MCVLRVTGTTFDAERYLALSGLTAINVFRAGEPFSITSPSVGEPHHTSGFTVDVSRDSLANLPGQVTDAIAFLKEHKQALTLLRSAPGVDDLRLDFPVDLRIDRQTVMAQFVYFSPELVSRAGELGLGLELSIYPRDFEALGRKASQAHDQAADS